MAYNCGKKNTTKPLEKMKRIIGFRENYTTWNKKKKLKIQDDLTPFQEKKSLDYTITNGNSPEVRSIETWIVM